MDATITLAAIPAEPPLQNLQFSPDGQVLLATRSSLNILTPGLGVNLDASSTAKIATGNFGWFRTVIDIGDLPPRDWFVDTQEWAAVALGSIERVLRSIAISPPFITTNGRSVIAILTSDMTLTLWTAPRNHIRGWNKVIDIVDVLRNALKTTKPISPLIQTLQLRATSIAWSSQPTFAQSSASLNSGSLLAVGTRAGSIHLLRYLDSTEEGKSMESVSTVEAGDRWVTQCAWVPWRVSDPHTVTSTLACGLSNGDVALVNVTQIFSFAENTRGSPFKLEITTEIRNEKVASPDKRIVTAMKWISRRDGTPGTVHVYATPSPSTLGPGLVDIRLKN